MNERTNRDVVTFDKPFFVEGLGREQAAGTYAVEILEELIDGLSFLAYRVVSTSIALPLPGGGSHSRQLVRIDPALVRSARQNGKTTANTDLYTRADADAT